MESVEDQADATMFVSKLENTIFGWGLNECAEYR